MGVKSDHIFLDLRKTSGQMLLQTHQAIAAGSRLGLDHHRTMFLAIDWVTHRRGSTAFLRCLFPNCLVLKIPSGLGGEPGIRLMNQLGKQLGWKPSYSNKNIALTLSF